MIDNLLNSGLYLFAFVFVLSVAHGKAGGERGDHAGVSAFGRGALLDLFLYLRCFLRGGSSCVADGGARLPFVAKMQAFAG